MSSIFSALGRAAGTLAQRSVNSFAEGFAKAGDAHRHTPGGSDPDTVHNTRGPRGRPVHAPQSSFADPYGLFETLSYKERPSSITFDTLRDIYLRLPVISTIVQTRVTQIAQFATPAADRYAMGFRIMLRDKREQPTRASRKIVDQFTTFISRTGVTNQPRARDNFETYLRKVARDSLMFDQHCTEIVPARDGRPSQFYAVDASLMRLAANIKPHVDQPLSEQTRYVEVFEGAIRTEFTADEMVMGIRNPNTDIHAQGYGQSELELLLTSVTSLLNAYQFNNQAFSNGSNARGILNIKDMISDDQLNGLQRVWNAMLRGEENAHRIPITNSSGGLEYIALPQPNDQQYGQWMDFLIKTCCFAAGTPVTMDDGRCKAIEHVVQGDRVMTHRGRARQVCGTQQSHFRGMLVCLKVGKDTLRATPEHPFYVVRSTSDVELPDPRWLMAQDIDASCDYLVAPVDAATQREGERPYALVPIDAITREPHMGPVYNFEVEEDHTYQVAQLAVHNCAAYSMSPEEINFKYGNTGQHSTFSEDSNRDKLIESRERGLRPLLRHFETIINQHLIHPIHESFVFEFAGLDSMTREESVDYNIKRIHSLYTINEIRAEDDLPALEGGDIISDPTYMQSLLQGRQQAGGGFDPMAAMMGQAPQQAGAPDPAAEEAPVYQDAQIEADEAVPDTPQQETVAASLVPSPTLSKAIRLDLRL